MSLATDNILYDVISDLANKKSYESIIDAAYTASGLINPTSSLWSSSHSINYSNKVSTTVPSKENIGYTLFVRPCFNLNQENLNNSRLLKPLGTEQESWMRAIRNLLDSYANTGLMENSISMSSKLVDPLSPFIPMLSNELLSISGFPDRTMDYFTSQAGRNAESMFIPDGIYGLNGVHNLNASFKTIAGNPILYMMCTWMCYTALVHDGVLKQYPIDDIEKRMGYTSSVFRLVTDESQQRLLRFGRTGYMLPTAVNEGASFSYESGKSFMNHANQVDVQLTFAGWVTNDIGYVEDFNRLCQRFNPKLGAAKRWPRLADGCQWSDFPELYYDSHFDMYRLDPYFFKYFPNHVYLWINLQDGWTLERWVHGKVFRSVINIKNAGNDNLVWADTTGSINDWANMA